MLKAILLCLALTNLSAALICPDGGTCEDGNTCCQTASGGYGCCPLPNAECCEDHLHCCHKGTICDLKHYRCNNKTHSLPWLEKVPTKVSAFPQDPSRSDGSPEDRQCSNGASGTGKKENTEAVICPDGESECPEETTCCQLPDGSWGCCPMVKAVCCDDKRHCCPEGTTCDTAHSKCLSPTREGTPIWKKFPARKREVWLDWIVAVNERSVTCQDGKSHCPDGTTCCQLTSGFSGCCPYPDAVCCTDHLHCCPGNATCDLEHKMCKTFNSQTTLGRKFPAVLNEIDCPDNSSKCPDATTCCKLKNGGYGCCPMPGAVCCEDLLHCCPQGTKCDLVHSTCVSASGNTSWATKLPAAKTPKLDKKVKNVPCNESVACADGSTCCKTTEGQWACCPLPEAVCCEDHLHCCPQHTICNLAASTCDDPAYSVPWLEKVPTFPWISETHHDEILEKQHSERRNTTCDSIHACPDKFTCCKMAKGDWACCPLPEAVCCEDGLHCCPHGTTCNQAAGTCDDSTGTGAWRVKEPALTQPADNEQCDDQMVCPGGTTCCKQNSGEWACCPLPHAVCCDDHEHCCPKGYKCDVSEKTCDKPGSLSLPWFKKQPALGKRQAEGSANSLPSERTQCDSYSHASCPKDNTCCYMNTVGKWGCCPLPKAVCCKDGDHCCPTGYKCDPSQTSCKKGSLVIPWYQKEKARVSPASPKDVKCDTQSSCAAGTTCCQLPTGQWGCCPLVKAVCCSDHEHCCPLGYSCNMKSGTCEKESGWLAEKVPLVRVSSTDEKTVL